MVARKGVTIMTTAQAHKARPINGTGALPPTDTLPSAAHAGTPPDRAAAEAPALKPLTVSVKTARQLLDIGNSKMWELIAEGQVQTISIGRKRLVLYHSLEALVRSGCAPK
jgi:hypothetical protein